MMMMMKPATYQEIANLCVCVLGYLSDIYNHFILDLAKYVKAAAINVVNNVMVASTNRQALSVRYVYTLITKSMLA